MEKISVCMATYNGEKYVSEQINSILSQLKAEDEVIISDDSSKDQTVKIINGINDKRIRLYHNTNPKGYSKNFENALKIASGDIIFVADQDDVWYPSKVEKMLAALKNADMAISDAEGVDENLKQLYPSHFLLNKTRKGFWINLLRTRYIGACMAFKKEVLQKALPLPKRNDLCAYDYWLAIVGECHFNIKLVNEPLLKYRRHGNNASSGGVSSHNSFLRKIEVRLYTLKELLKRR